MIRKRWSYLIAGSLAAIAAFLVGFSWYNASANGGTIGDTWDDVKQVRTFNDFVRVVTGENARHRREAEERLIALLETAEGGSRRAAVQTERSLDALNALLEQNSGPPTTSLMFGGTPSRNMANTIDKNIPITWNVEEGKLKNIKWVADLGDHTYSSPVIADGKVFIGTNNKFPRDPKVKEPDKAVLMAFNEADGKFLWQLVHEMSDVSEYRNFGLVATPMVEGKRIYYTTPACIVVCADTDGKIQWTFDMMKELKVYPHHCAGSSPLVVGDLLMIMTGNGRDAEGKLVAPMAPSFVAFNKNTGKVAWQSNLPGKRIIEGQWSIPTLITVNGKQQVIFAGGDCVLYSFEPATGKLIWSCDCNPTRNKNGDDRYIDNYIVAAPVAVGERLYVGLGPMPDHSKKQRVSYFLCLDAAKQGDVSLKSYDVKDAANKNSALVWAFGGPIQPAPKKGRDVYIGVICGTAAVHDGLVFISEERGDLHCLDAKTGQQYWEHDFKDSSWGSPYYVDGKVYLGMEVGDVFIFEASKNKKIIAKVSMEDPLHGTPVVAGGVLYINTMSKLYAIR